jgi:hypothetical protein
MRMLPPPAGIPSDVARYRRFELVVAARMNFDPGRRDRFDGNAEGPAEHVLERHQPVALPGSLVEPVAAVVEATGGDQEHRGGHHREQNQHIAGRRVRAGRAAGFEGDQPRR